MNIDVLAGVGTSLLDTQLHDIVNIALCLCSLAALWAFFLLYATIVITRRFNEFIGENITDWDGLKVEHSSD